MFSLAVNSLRTVFASCCKNLTQAKLRRNFWTIHANMVNCKGKERKSCLSFNQILRKTAERRSIVMTKSDSSHKAFKRRENVRGIFLALLALIIAGALFFIVSNLVIMGREEPKILAKNRIAPENAQCILILGAGVWDGGVPSPMLQDRLEEGLRLYREEAAPKIIVSGDHGRQEYDEVNVMKQYLIDAGVPSEDIFMDHAGFSTYESMVRAKEVFGVQRMIVVSQKYHLFRALYITEKLGIEARGAAADPRKYQGEFYRNVREWLARDKDIFYCLFKVPPKYLGDPIDLGGSGNVTND